MAKDKRGMTLVFDVDLDAEESVNGKPLTALQGAIAALQQAAVHSQRRPAHLSKMAHAQPLDGDR